MRLLHKFWESKWSGGDLPGGLRRPRARICQAISIATFHTRSGDPQSAAETGFVFLTRCSAQAKPGFATCNGALELKHRGQETAAPCWTENNRRTRGHSFARRPEVD